MQYQKTEQQRIASYACGWNDASMGRDARTSTDADYLLGYMDAQG